MAKKFRFRLEPLLKYRRHLDEQARRELALAHRRALDQNQVLLKLLQDEYAAKKRMTALKSRAELSVREVRMNEQFLLGTARRIRREYEGLQNLLLREQQARRVLVEARRKMRVLERLKERRKAGYDYELSRAERKELDEIGLEMYRKESQAS